MSVSRFPSLSPALILLADNIIHADECSYEPPDLDAGDPGVDCDCYVEKFYGFLSDELARLERLANRGDPEIVQAIVSALPDYPHGRDPIKYASHVGAAFTEAMACLRVIAIQCDPGPARILARTAWTHAESLVSHRVLDERDVDFSPTPAPIDQLGEMTKNG